MMNKFEIIKNWKPTRKYFFLNIDRWTKNELKLILILLHRGEISLRDEE